MVYESDFYTTRRSYRPTVTSYSVSTPFRYTPGLARVHTYSTTYPIYSYSYHHSLPYVAHKRLVTGTRILSSPVRVTSSPIRIVHTPAVRILRTPARVIRSPIRIYSSPIRVFSSPIRVISSPMRVITTPARVITSPIRVFESPVRYTESPIRFIASPERILYTHRPRTAYLHREYQRIQNKVRSRPAYRPLEDYLNSESFINFDDETRRIRSSAATILREIQAPVPRRARSTTPFPIVSRYDPLSSYEPKSSYAADSYVSRILTPVRHVTQDITNMSYYTDGVRKYPGKCHLASVRIVGNKGYTIRNPLYDSDRVKNDVEYLSHYLKNRRAASEKLISKIPLESVDAVAAKEVLG